ncbi:glycosyltransferase [Halomonas sp. hl-4]|uniref:glycosyltransferase n=1 Tax=Halomonas sp. hl-4 TaxID=1761789 RepID=UPI000BB8C0D0|nr:glycosyltransferase [Halomonas sp. hl-4]SNY96751.1 Glycosyltransferase involved in cell wall bisynthesis [Halomonas sp. hl-4]
MKIIVSLVSNPGTTDARVMKQARSLARAGHKVYIYGRIAAGFSEYEYINDNIHVYRFECFSENLVKKNKIEEMLSPAGVDVVNLFSSYLNSYFNSINALASLLPERNILLSKLYAVNDKINNIKIKRKKLLKVMNSDYKELCPMLSIGFFSYRQFDKRKAYNSNKLEFDRLCLEIEEGKEERERLKKKLRCFDKDNNREKYCNKIKEQLYYVRYFFYATNLLDFVGDISPDVIHSHDLHPLLGAVLLSKKTGAKVVYDAHEIEVERVPPLPVEKKSFIDSLERGLFKKIDHIITVCNFAVDFYDERFPGCRPTLVMNSPEINIDKYKNNFFDIKHLTGLNPKDKVIIYVGGIGREARGLDKLILSMAKLEDFYLVILGPRHESNDCWLLNLAKEANVAERIHMLPSVPSDIVVPTIQTADLGVCLIQDVSLSYRYSMPNKLFEMAFAGVPIVVSNLPEMSGFIKELNIGVVVDQANPDDIAIGILKAYTYKKMHADFSEINKFLEEKYSWHAQEKNLLKVYSMLV